MKKYLAMIVMTICMIFVGSPFVSAERSYTIDRVTIDAQIDEKGIMHVTEIYTYTFSGSYEGVSRSIGSNVTEFKAFLVGEHLEGKLELYSDIEPLTVEKIDDTYRMYSNSENETKHFLYHYQVEGSVKKYLDIADITYDFFDEANETDISNLTITFTTPHANISNQTHAFLRDHSGELLTTEHNNIRYTNEFLKAGERTRIRLIFPAEELSEMQVTKNINRYDKILEEENDYLNKLENLDEKMSALIPIILVLFLILAASIIVVFIIHPNRYRGYKSDDELVQVLERTDPLFVSYLDMNEGVHDQSIIAALFSLRRRGIVKFSEVSSLIHEHINTFRITWIKEHAKIDAADLFLRNWLFTEEDEKGRYFLLESIIDNPDESDSIREEKAKSLRKQFDKWEGLVSEREEYQGLRKRFRGYSIFSVFFVTITFSLFYYLVQIEPISQMEQIILPITSGLLAFVSVLFNRRKWVFSIFYLFIIVASFIAFTISPTLILIIVFFMLSYITLLIIPTLYWREDINEIKYAMRKVYHLMVKSNYPIGEETTEIEQQLEYAIILGAGESFADQCGEETRLHKLNVENSLLRNPVFVTDSFNSNNFILYSTVHIGTSSYSGSSTTTTSSTGGGGAGAF